MIGIDTAQQRIRESITPTDSLELPVDDVLGYVLAEDVASDIDSPPYDKSLVDGYALQAADISVGDSQLEIVEEVVAGDLPQHAVAPGRATRIMTGAPIPAGADAVVMIEKTETVDGGRQVIIRETGVTPGQSIMRQGLSMKRGQVVLRAGCLLRSIEVGLLTEVGRSKARVFRKPSVALVQTGDELVRADEPLRAGQIRNSNGPMLCSLVRRAGGQPVDLGVARDEETALAQRISQGLEADLLILSGGVSAGVKDLVPAQLAKAGVREVFHKVEIRPGKPIWFGIAEPSGTLVFGLPGNPVSSLVCFWILVMPAIRQRAGQGTPELIGSTARLESAHSIRGARPTYWPAIRRLGKHANDESVELLNWQGSADLRTLAAANCLVFFSQGDRDYQPGETVRVIWLD